MTISKIASSSEAAARQWRAADLVRARHDGRADKLPEQIEARIGELIDGGDLAPGSRLPSERELARIFGVSRLAVREAAHRLEARGLVTIRRGAGSFVASRRAGPAPAPSALPRLPAVEELSDVRMLLEPAAADWAARRAERETIGVLLRLAEQFEEAAASPKPRFDLLSESDLQLHLEIALAADNTLLAQLVEQLHALYRVQLDWSLRRPGRLEETAVEHRRLVDAIAAGDPAAAREAMVAHLASAVASFRAVTADNPVVD